MPGAGEIAGWRGIQNLRRNEVSGRKRSSYSCRRSMHRVEVETLILAPCRREAGKLPAGRQGVRRPRRRHDTLQVCDVVSRVQSGITSQHAVRCIGRQSVECLVAKKRKEVIRTAGGTIRQRALGPPRNPSEKKLNRLGKKRARLRCARAGFCSRRCGELSMVWRR